MKKWTTLDEAVTPDGGKMTLRERDGVYVIFLDRYELMSTRMVESERQLAEVGCASIKSRPKARVLIGGLGMGFTLKAVLEQLGRDATVVVAELMAEVIKWNQNPEYPLAAEALRDKRVKIVNDDVVHVIQSASDSFDAILLDVDNGPAAFTVDSNHRLYGADGLSLAFRALRPKGVFAVWSVDESKAFIKTLAGQRFQAEMVKATAHGRSGHRTIFLATRH